MNLRSDRVGNSHTPLFMPLLQERCGGTTSPLRGSFVRSMRVPPTFFTLSRTECNLKTHSLVKTQFDTIETEVIEKARRDVDSEYKDLPDTITNRSKTRQRQPQLTRQSKLWIPLGRCLRLVGLIANGTVLRGPELRNGVFRHCVVFFQTKTIGAVLVTATISKYAPNYDRTLVRPICVGEYSRFLERAPHSQPGFDGLPSCAWRIAGRLGAQQFHGFGAWMCSAWIKAHGNPPKGDSPNDSQEFVWVGGDTRPLSPSKTRITKPSLPFTMPRLFLLSAKGFLHPKGFHPRAANLE